MEMMEEGKSRHLRTQRCLRAVSTQPATTLTLVKRVTCFTGVNGKGQEKYCPQKCWVAENQNEAAKRSVPNFDGEGGGEKADARRRVHTAVGKARNRAKRDGRPSGTYTRAPAPPGRSSSQKTEAAKVWWRLPIIFFSRHQDSLYDNRRRWHDQTWKPACAHQKSCHQQPCDAFYQVSFLCLLCRSPQKPAVVATEKWKHGSRHSMQAYSHPFRMMHPNHNHPERRLVQRLYSMRSLAR